jgi:hypothetical protein
MDNGKTWDTIKQLIPSEYRLSTIAALALINNRLVYAINDTLFSHENNKETTLNISPKKIFSLKCNPINKSEWFACGEQLLYTVNDGITFQSIKETVEKPFEAKKCDIAFGPNKTVVIAHKSEGNFYYELSKDRKLVNKKTAYVNIDLYRATIVYDDFRDRFLVGGVRLYALQNDNFSQITTPQFPDAQHVHDDIRKIVFTKEGHILLAHDAGISISENGGKKWFNINGCGLNITEVYDFDFNDNQLIMGAQDLSSFAYDKKQKKWSHFSDLYGDGGSCLITDSLSFVMRGTSLQSFTKHQRFTTEVTKKPISSFTPIIILDNNQLYLADKILWKKTNSVWQNISPEVDDNYSISSFIKKGSIMFLSKEDPVWKSGNLSKKLYKTINGGQSWLDITQYFKTYAYREISDMCFALNSDSIIYASIGSFDSESGSKEKVFISTNQGESWINISYNLPNVPCNSIAELDGIGLVVGTDCGIYILNKKSWLRYGNGLPQCPVTKLKKYKGGLIASTYGRGLWLLK